MMHTSFLILASLFGTFVLNAQDLLTTKTVFTKQDTLRGSITPERAWWDLTYYHLDIKVNPEEKLISGKNTIQYRVLQEQNVMQIDLQPPLQLTQAVQNGKSLNIEHLGNAHFITLKDTQQIGTLNTLEVHYTGHPKEAITPPWDGGITWHKDRHGNPFVASSCQGLGASVWWPCKDHLYDEVDSMLISVNVPKDLMDVSNGRLRKVESHGATKTYHWFVDNPINNYGVNINIGDYVHFSEIYSGEKGPLTMDYYVLRDHLQKAKEHFKDAPKMMKAFEFWFGPYPFYKDGYKLVEAPYLGMEHQSSVTYGNHFRNGYLGRDLSGTGWGLKFDFIIIHESGHEWFANNITDKDIADMWIHESFTAYSESLFLDYYYGKQAASDYTIGTRSSIKNDRPIIGLYNVNEEGSGDMYYKGANMIHTLRQWVDDDGQFRNILREMNRVFYHQTVTTQQIENYLCQATGYDLEAFFDQYLRTTRVPSFHYRIAGKTLYYYWSDVVPNFEMPLRVSINEQVLWLSPSTEEKKLTRPHTIAQVVVDPNFYVKIARDD